MMTRISGKLPGVAIVNHDSDVQEILRRRGVFVPGAKPPKTGVMRVKEFSGDPAPSTERMFLLFQTAPDLWQNAGQVSQATGW
jgi:hypothetical protein